MNQYQDYPTEAGSQNAAPAGAAYGNQAPDDGYHHFYNPDDDRSDGSYEPEASDEAPSETPTEEHERRAREAETVWFSGYFSGKSYVPKQKYVNHAALSDSFREELLTNITYAVPRGYRYYDEDLPAIINSTPTGNLMIATIVYMVLTFIAFVMLLAAACPIPWFKGKNVIVDGKSYKGRQYQLWRQKGADRPIVSLRGLRDCPIEKQFFQTIGASTVMACCFAFGALISCAVLLGGKGSYGWTLLMGFLAFAWALCANAMSISAYHLDRCDKPRFVTIARLDAGFALSAIAWVFMMFGLIILALATRLNIGPSLRKVRVMDTYYLILVWFSLAFCIIASVGTIWKRRFNTPDVRVVRVTYWHTELIMGNGTSIIFGRAHYRCSAFNKRIKASVSFLILGCVALGLSAFLGLGSYVSRSSRIGSCITTICASAFLFVSWVTAVDSQYRKLCNNPVTGSVYEDYIGVPSGVYNGLTRFKTYGLQEGVVLVIIAWIACTAAVILNFVVPWPKVSLFSE